MPSLPQPSQLIKCDNLSSCLQNLYNLLFAIFVGLAFLYFLYGAFEYLLSGSGIYKKESGKNRMKNSIIALIVVLIIPIILKLINPEIFKIQLLIPHTTITPVIVKIDIEDMEELGFEERDVTYVRKKFGEPYIKETTRSGYTRYVAVNEINKFYAEGIFPGDQWDWRNVFSHSKLYCLKPKNNNNGTEYINPIMKDVILKLDKEWCLQVCRSYPPQSCPYYLRVNDGYNPDRRVHPEKYFPGHTVYGVAIDVVPIDKDGKKIENVNDPVWQKIIEIATQIGFNVYDERLNRKGGSHLHLCVNVNNHRCI